MAGGTEPQGTGACRPCAAGVRPTVRARTQVVAALMGALLVVGASCSMDQPVSDELSDFSTTTTEPEPVDPNSLYGRYADEASDAGLTPLGASEADSRASNLCFDDLSASKAFDEARGAITHDVLIVRTWCPAFDPDR